MMAVVRLLERTADDVSKPHERKAQLIFICKDCRIKNQKMTDLFPPFVGDPIFGRSVLSMVQRSGV
jgi:hypothetical protein